MCREEQKSRRKAPRPDAGTARPVSMKKMVLKGVCQTLILMTALLLIIVETVFLPFKMISQATLSDDEIMELLEDFTDNQEKTPPEAAEPEPAAAPSSNRLENAVQSLREKILTLAIENPRYLGLFYAGMFLLIALFLLPGLPPRGKGLRRTVTLVNAGLYLACGIPFLITGYTETAVLIMNILYTAVLALETVLRLKEKRTRSRFTLWTSLLVLSVANLVSFPTLPYFVLGIVVMRSVKQIMKIAFSHIPLDVIKKIIRKTYAAEILLGLFMLIFTFSLLLALLDDGIHSFQDALWFCFATVTTIGYGDVASVSAIGRVLAVILGIYGIVVVALITSIIVNFYNETKESDGEPPEEHPEA